MTTKENQTTAKDTKKESDTKQAGSKPKQFGNGKGSRKPKNQKNEVKEEFEQRILDVARVTRVMAGGKRMSFRTCVAVGDKNGRIGIGVDKGADVSEAVNKAVNKAKKDLVNVPLLDETIPHEIKQKHGAAVILFKPARAGKGVIAGGVVRVILELAGVKNISSKILGTNNKMNNARCTLEALRNLKKVENVEAKKETEEVKENSKKENK